MEESKKKFSLTVAELDKKVRSLTDAKDRIANNIIERKQKVYQLQEKLNTESSDNFIDERTFDHLERAIKSIYTDIMGSEEMHAEPIRMLKAIEGKFMGFLQYFDEIEEASESNKNWMQNAIKTKAIEIRKERLERRLEEKKQTDREKQEKYLRRAADNAKGKTWGKPLMTKCRVPEKKKVVVEKHVDPEELFFREFLNG